VDAVPAPDRGGLTGLGQHLGRHVDADDLAAGADLTGGDERIEPSAGADVDDLLARQQPPQRDGFPTPAKDSTARSGSASTARAS
jgi:hypothetical protein